MHDLVIRGGKVIDGSGTPARTADVAVRGERIVEVGQVSGRGRREIDADGLLVTPGFVDIHTHYDAQVSWDPQLTPSSWHGVTTVVMGNCGVGFAPAIPDRHDWLIGLMEGVEDIPGAAMTEGITWGWESFPEYLDIIGAKSHAIDFGTQVPHGALRAYVMGDRGADNEDATAEDIAAMRAIVVEALKAGALGFSTSRTMLHKSISGDPVPGTFAARDELLGIGAALKDAGTGVFQLATDHLKVPEELDWMQELSLQTGRPVMFNLSQTDQAPTLWRDVLAKLDRARAAGAQVYGQVAGRAIGVMMNWNITAHPFATYPSFLEMMHLEPEARLAALRDPEVRAKILADEPMHFGEFETFVTTSWHKMFVSPDGVDYEPSPETSIAAIAAASGRRPQEVAYDEMMKRDGRAMLYFPLFNYADGDLELLHTLHQHPSTRMGLSDAGAHCGAVCDGGMPTFMLTHWARDRSRGERLPLEHIIHRQTRQTAEAFGFMDRGLIAAGLKADLNVIDFEGLHLEAPEIVYDLPAGGRRLCQRARGYEATICSGEVISEKGTPTEQLPGKLLRGAQVDPRG